MTALAQSIAPARRKVYLYGYMAECFGSEFTLAVRTPAKALRLLEANFSGKFFEKLREGSFHILVGDENSGVYDAASEELLHLDYGNRPIHIIPVPEGSGGGGNGRGKGVFQIIIGVVLIAVAVAAAIASGGTSLAAMAATPMLWGTVSAGSVALLGGALILSGIATLMTPTPKAASEGDENSTESYMNTGPTNITRDNTAVPLIYGHPPSCGSVLVAVGVTNERIDPNATAINGNSFVTVSS